MYRVHECGCVGVCAAMMFLTQQGFHSHRYNAHWSSWGYALLGLWAVLVGALTGERTSNVKACLASQCLHHDSD